jgi:cobalt-zinc-cadmium efflux system outer membrane protein
MKMRWAALAATIAAAAAARGEEARPITFAEARAAAERLAPDVLRAERREGVAEADVAVAGTWQNPTLTVESATLTARLITAVSVPLPIFGQVGTQEDAARAALATARMDTSATRKDARFAATVAWIDLREAGERARVLADAAGDAERTAEIARQRFEAGSAPRIDVVRATADRARARAEAATADAAVRAASARLSAFLGEPAALRAAGPPDYRRDLPARSALAATVDEHPALRRDRAAVEAAAARVRAEKRQRAPIVAAQLSVSQLDPTQPGTDFMFGLSFEVPLFNFRGGAIARARADEALARTEVDAERRQLDSQLHDAVERADGASARMRALETEVLPAMTEARGMTEDAYRDGRVDLTRLLEAQRALLDSRAALVEAEAVWARAVADVERAAGRFDGGADGR